MVVGREGRRMTFVALLSAERISVGRRRWPVVTDTGRMRMFFKEARQVVDLSREFHRQRNGARQEAGCAGRPRWKTAIGSYVKSAGDTDFAARVEE